MSAGIDQRMKGQGTQGGGHNGIGRGYLKLPSYCQFGTVAAPVSNGSKDPMNDEEFDSWRSQQQQQQQQQQSYSTPISASNMGDPYSMPSYYGMSYPYQNLGIGGDGPWSNGGDPMTFLSGYGGQMGSEQHSHYMDGMFGGFNQPGFNYFHGNGDYSAWGNTAVGRKPNTQGPYEDYYRDVYGDQVMDRGLKPVEQGLQGLSIVDKSDCKQDLKGDVMVEGGIPKKMSWASVASQPAKPHPKTRSKGMPPPVLAGRHNMDIGTWDSKNGNNTTSPSSRAPWSAPRGRAAAYGGTAPLSTNPNTMPGNPNFPQHPVLDKLRQSNEYNPKEYDLNPKGARFFIIKSYSEDDIHRSIKYGIWCSTDHGNKRLDTAFRETKGPIMLFYSVNGSGHFCGMAQMDSELDYQASSGVWAQDKWKGEFKVKWIYVKDVPNSQLRHIRLENNENKPVTNSRDTQEVPFEKGKQVLKILHNYRHTTSIFDDFVHYEKRQEEEDQSRQDEP